MRLIDSHCHLHLINYAELGQTQNEVVTAARAVNIERMLCVATTLAHLPTLQQLAENIPEVKISAGMHPNETANTEPTVEDYRQGGVLRDVVAIGETGLDYHWETVTPNIQQQRFVKQIQAARQCEKPLIIHTRSAKKDTIEIMRTEGADQVGGVMHCFTEDWEMAQQALDLNFYISFSGIVTFKNAVELQTVAKKVPLDRILIETDCPYLAPVPKRGKINQPAYVAHVASFIAKLREEPIEKVAEATTENYYRLFEG